MRLRERDKAHSGTGLISAYALRGDSERAAGELAEAQKLNPDRHMSIAREQVARVFAVPKIRALFAPLISPVCGKPF